MIRIRRHKKARPPVGQLIPPEGVPLQLDVAGVGVRLAAQLVDIILTVIAFVSLLLLLIFSEIGGPNSLYAIANLLFFAIRVPYYILAELAWNGQTLGKRLMKIKVVAHDGGPLTVHALVLRNLMKEAEVFLPGTLLLTLSEAQPLASLAAMAWIVMAFLVPLLNRYRRRLGDILAGTHVIHLPVPILLKDLAREPVQGFSKPVSFAFLAHHLDHYGAFELQALEGVLRGRSASNYNETVKVIVEKIRRKIDYADKVEPGARLAFLQAFYSAQRQHLEQRQLFGDQRKDKYHREEAANAAKDKL